MQTNSEDYLGSMLKEHRALVILLTLVRSSGASNEELMSTVLDRLALGGSRDAVRESFNGLEAQGLLRINFVGRVMVAELTERGEEVAKGKIAVDGVLSPSVGSHY